MATTMKELYDLPPETIKANAEAMKRESESVLSPSQEDVDEAVSGYPKRRAERARAAGKAAAKPVEKNTFADEPEATYRTRTIKPSSKS